jgi:hypothetical protein
MKIFLDSTVTIQPPFSLNYAPDPVSATGTFPRLVKISITPPEASVEVAVKE